MNARALAALALCGGLVLSGCGDAEPTTAPEETLTPTPRASVEVPSGVDLTEPGDELAFGDTGTVAYVPNASRSTVLEIVVESVREGRISDLSGFQLDEASKKTTPYYAQVRVENAGEGTVGGTGVPLWASAEGPTFVQSSGFTSTFETCPSEPLPRGFEPGATYDGCLVFLMPEGTELGGVAFRGTGDEDAITWAGTVATPKPSPSPKPTKKATKKATP